jgi:hypothetical protein
MRVGGVELTPPPLHAEPAKHLILVENLVANDEILRIRQNDE